MKNLLKQLDETYEAMRITAHALLKAGHTDKSLEMSGAASIVDGWMQSLKDSKGKDDE